VTYLNKHHSKNMYGGVELYLHSFVTTALGGESSGSRSGRFTPMKVSPVPIG